MNFQKEKIENMSDRDVILDYIGKKLISFHNLYQDLVLPLDPLELLIIKCKTYDEIFVLLSYSGTDVFKFLYLFDKVFENTKLKFEQKVDQKVKEELAIKDINEVYPSIIEKNIKRFKVDEFVIPKIGDNLIDILDTMEFISISEVTKKIKLIENIENLINKYMELYNGKNLNNLYLIKRYIGYWQNGWINKEDENFLVNYNGIKTKKIELLYHETGINLIKRKELKNIEIVCFMKNDSIFYDEKYESLKYRPLEIFDGIEIETLDENFFEEWKNLDFKKMFPTIYFDKFRDKICSLIKDMKYFGLLYKFFSFKNMNENNILNNYLEIKEAYVRLLPSYKKDKCSNFYDETIDLISFFDKNKKNEIKDLLTPIQKNLDFETVNNIYIGLSEGNLKDITKEIMVDYLISKEKYQDPSSLVSLIENCPNLRMHIFSKISKYSLAIEDFFEIEETVNYKIFKGLIGNKIIIRNSEFKKAGYIKAGVDTFSAIENNIKEYNISFNEISIFFENEKNKDIFKNRLYYLNFLDEKKSNEQFRNLEKKFNEIKKYIEYFEIIYNDFNEFFPIKLEKDLDKISKIISNLKNEKMNNIDKIYDEEKKYYAKYLEDAKRRNKLKESNFFNEILKFNQKNISRFNENKIQAKTENEFNQLKIIFKNEGITKVDEKISEVCLLPFQKNGENLKKELEALSKLFKKGLDIENKYNEILIFAKRRFIIDSATAIKVFLDKIQPTKTKYIDDIENLIKVMREKNDIKTIEISYNNLKKLINLDENGNKNQLIHILIKLKEQPESIGFLLDKNKDEIGKLHEIATLDENKFVNANDILDLEKCFEFFLKIGQGDVKGMQNMTDTAIIQEMETIFKNQKDIYAYFERYVNNFGQIKMLQSSVNIEESLKYKIKSLFNGCKFFLSNDNPKNKKEILFVCKYDAIINREKKEIILGKEDINTLKDKALLSKTITADIQYFIDSILEINNISNIMKEIYNKGYPQIIKVEIYYKVDIINADEKNEIKINNKETKYYLNGSDKKSFDQIIRGLQNILKDIKERQLEAYKNKPLIRYLYGRQFNLLSEVINEEKNKSIDSLLKYITNDSYQNKVEKFKLRKEENLIQNNIDDWNDYLNSVLKQNNLTLEKIYKPTLIDKKFGENNNGLFTYNDADGLEYDLFKIFKYLTGNKPIAQNILVCTKMTSNEEITVFLYRALLCNYNSCFIITGLESLGIEAQETIINLLDNYYMGKKERKEIKSCLIFLFGTKNSDIYKSFELKKYRKFLKINEDIKILHMKKMI